MDYTQITQLITTVGFPIVAYLLMWKTLLDTSAAHKEEMNALRETLANNTVVLAELKTLIEDLKCTAHGKGQEAEKQ